MEKKVKPGPEASAASEGQEPKLTSKKANYVKKYKVTLKLTRRYRPSPANLPQSNHILINLITTANALIIPHSFYGASQPRQIYFLL